MRGADLHRQREDGDDVCSIYDFKTETATGVGPERRAPTVLLKRPSRFTELLARLPGIGTSVLTDRLRTLERAPVVTRDARTTADFLDRWTAGQTGRDDGRAAGEVVIEGPESAWPRRLATAGYLLRVDDQEARSVPNIRRRERPFADGAGGPDAGRFPSSWDVSLWAGPVRSRGERRDGPARHGEASP